MQQKATVLSASHPLQGLQGLARSIALPHESTPVRYPSFPSLERTALMSFSVPTTLNLPASSGVKGFVTRQAIWPTWAVQTTAGGVGQVVQWGFGQEGFSLPIGTQSITMVTPEVTAAASTNTTASTENIGTSGLTSAYFSYPILGYDSGWTYAYIPAGATKAYGVTGGGAFPTGSGIKVTWRKWVAPGESIHFSPSALNPIVPGANLGNADVFGFPPGIEDTYGTWICPESIEYVQTGAGTPPLNMSIHIAWGNGTVVYGPSPVTQGTYSFGSATTSLMLPLSSPAEYSNSVLPWSNTRTTATSALFTNVTQVLNKAGTVLAGRVAPSTKSPWDTTSTFMNTLHPAEKSFLPLETGLYTYVPPSTDLVEFYDYTVVGKTGYPQYRLDNPSLVNHFYFVPSSVAETLAVTIDWHIEFRTSSALFQIGVTPVALETLHQAQVALHSLGYFFENPDHKRIQGMLQKILKAALRYGPGIANAIHPSLGMAARSVKSYIVSRNPRRTNRMKPTSAVASGIVSKGQGRNSNRRKGKPPQLNQRTPSKPKLRSGLDMYLATRPR